MREPEMQNGTDIVNDFLKFFRRMPIPMDTPQNMSKQSGKRCGAFTKRSWGAKRDRIAHWKQAHSPQEFKRIMREQGYSK
jgi:hypothetical protein